MKQRPFPVGKEPGFTVKMFVRNRHELAVFHAAKEAAAAGKGKKTGVTKA
jgi:hypothetical protein